MLIGLFWVLAMLAGLVGMALLVAGWELLRRRPQPLPMAAPVRAHSIDVQLGEATEPAGKPAAPPVDSDARRRALAHAIERMSEPARPQPGAEVGFRPAPQPATRIAWEDTQPRVNLPTVAEPTRSD